MTVVLTAAQHAAKLLRDEFHREGGPRGVHGHAPVDKEAELLIRESLLSSFPNDAYLGEETGSFAPQANRQRLWIVDPNDGTSAYLRGFRGAAISIALLDNGKPVLGLVFAYNYPDDHGDLIYWHEGSEIVRNGEKVSLRALQEPSRDGVVMVSQDADLNPSENIQLVAPMRYWTMPSIAYRLALVAAGDADAATSLNSPTTWDLAAGHALLIGAGLDLFDNHEQPIRYTNDGELQTSAAFHVFGGSSQMARHLARNSWSGVYARPKLDSLYGLSQPKPGVTEKDPHKLSRAQGCLLGQLAGDALGSLVEFRSAESIKDQYPEGVNTLLDGGTWDTIAGQPTDDSEMALINARGKLNPINGVNPYQYWLDSKPFDIGATISRGLIGNINPRSQSNGALMRISPLGILNENFLEDFSLDYIIKLDTQITHTHPLCIQANILFTRAIRYAIQKSPPPEDLYKQVLGWAGEISVEKSLMEAIIEARTNPPADYLTQQGWVLIAFQNALYQLLHTSSFKEGVINTVMAGGDTDTNGAICGALLGSVHGRDKIPFKWRRNILTCRPDAVYQGCKQPRPIDFWPVDALSLAEQLLAHKGIDS
jgi:ADP-ribosylglycohydrolase/fructose-1,6-bisphosphatase/inositol monophosphatase family enzyme